MVCFRYCKKHEKFSEEITHATSDIFSECEEILFIFFPLFEAIHRHAENDLPATSMSIKLEEFKSLELGA
jgi:hypothetical protein